MDEWTFDTELDDDEFGNEERTRVVAFNGNRGGGKTPYRHKTNRGSMFENDRKTKESQPDFTGSIDVDGTIYWLHGWKDMTPSGKKRLSVSVQLQEERTQQQQRQESAPARQKSGW